MLITTFFLQWW